MAEPKTEWQRRQDELVKSMEDLKLLIEEALRILKGDTTTPGVVERLDRHEAILHGDSEGKEMGLVMKNKLMWQGGRLLAGALLISLGYVLHPMFLKIGSMVGSVMK